MASSLFLSTGDRRDHRDDRAEFLAKPVQSDRADFNRLSAGEAWSGVVEYGEPRLARLISAVLLGQERVHAGLQPSQAGIGVQLGKHDFEKYSDRLMFNERFPSSG
jgi:hypothetical protein